MKTFWSILFFIVLCWTLSPKGLASTVTQVAVGDDAEHSLFLASDGSLWGMGYNEDGELGNGLSNNVFVPEKLVSNGVTNIAAGSYHSLFIKSDGSLWGMGYNAYGELGVGSTSNQYTPVEIVSGGVIAVAGGYEHTLFLKSDGSLWGMGYNGDGELGLGTTATNPAIPVEIVSSGVKAIAAGDYHSLFIKSDGSLWAMGWNSSGQLGNGVTSSQDTPVEVLTGVTAVVGGYEHTLAIKTNGTLWATGDNSYGELGDGTETSHSTFEQITTGVSLVAAGDDFSLFVKTNGSLWGMGWNYWGQLGDGSFAYTVTTPVEAVTNGVTAIAAGYAHSILIQSGALWDMGYDNQGQLGDNGRWAYYGENVPQKIDFVSVAEQMTSQSPVTVQFSSPSTDFYGTPIASWLWNFGDGSTNTAQNPSHAYFLQGSYVPTVSMTLNNGSNVEMTAGGPFVVAGLVQNGGFETGDFSDWTFPDGTSYTSVTSDSTYVYSGNYGAELGPSSVEYMQQTLPTVPGQTYVLSFWLTESGYPEDIFQAQWGTNMLLDLVNDADTNWVNYQFSVTATDTSTVLQFGVMADDYFGLDNIGVTPISNIVTFAAAPLAVVAPQPVQFTAPSQDSAGHPLTNWLWNFGDGASSMSQNPSHRYFTFGTFAPSLLALDSTGASVLGTGPQITVAQPTVQFTASETNGAAPLTVQFGSGAVDSGGSTITNWSWNFGDLSATSTSALENPSHTYATEGDFTVSFLATNEYGLEVVGVGPTSITSSGLVANPSFEDLDTNGDAIGWNLGDTNGQYAFGVYTEQRGALFGTNVLEFNNSPSAAWQQLTTTPGVGYLLSFWIDPDNSEAAFMASWNGQTIFNQTNLNYGWTNVQLYVIATGTNAILQFECLPVSRATIYLDGVSVTPAEVEPFSATPPAGPIQLNVQFTAPTTDTEGGTITNWQWNFGDGSPVSRAQNPSHLYTNVGIYNPTLVCTNNNGMWVSGISGVTVTTRLPSLPITATPSNGLEPLAVQFTVPSTDDSGQIATNWHWNFGDGSTSTVQNPAHTFYWDGTNYVTLTAVNAAGIEVTDAPLPIVVAYNGGLVQNGDFTNGLAGWTSIGYDVYPSGPGYGHLGLGTVLSEAPGSFSQISQTIPTTPGAGYLISYWTSGSAPPYFNVSWNGTNLAVSTNTSSSNWTNVTAYVVATSNNTVLEFSTTNFFEITEISVLPLEVEPAAASPVTGPIPLAVQFSAPATDSAGNPVASWSWTFGDGGTSSEQNPAHTYTNIGTYYPTLSVTLQGGAVVPATPPEITGVLPSVQFTATPTNGVNPLIVQFTAPATDNTGRSLTNWLWNFGDGSTSTAASPQHAYTMVSNYTASLIATNSAGIEVLGTGPVLSVAFDSGAVSNGAFSTGDFTGWTATGNIGPEIVNFGLGGWYSTYYSAYLFYPQDELTQNVPTSPGATYLLSFWLLYNSYATNGGPFIVSWNGVNILTLTNFLDAAWTNYQVPVIATDTNAVLEFSETNNSPFYLSDISVLPAAAFTATPSNGFAPLAVNFSAPSADGAGNAITNWLWEFGDGSMATGHQASHTYGVGNFSPALYVINSAGVTLPAIGPSISSVFNGGIVSNGNFGTGSFAGWNASTGSITTNSTYVFGGEYGVQIGTTLLRPISQTLTTVPGQSYVISFWLENTSTSSNEFEVIWNGTTVLNDRNLPQFGWTNFQIQVTATSGTTPLVFEFQNNPWFGFDDVSVLPASSSEPTVQFTASPTNGGGPLAVQFNSPGIDSSGKTITAWSWNFGDGGTSTIQNPSHTYAAIGSYTPSLLATNNAGGQVVGIGPSITVAYNGGIVSNGNFGTGTFAGWTADSGSVVTAAQYVYSGQYGVQVGPGSLQPIFQTLATVPGKSYLLSFWLENFANGGNTQFVVSWNGTNLFSEQSLPEFSWTNFQFDVTASSSSTLLEFEFLNGPSWFGFDDVSVLPISTVPASLGIVAVTRSGQNLVINGTNAPSGSLILLTSTNLALPVNQWTPILTNNLQSSGSFSVTLTNALRAVSAQNYYILLSGN